MGVVVRSAVSLFVAISVLVAQPILSASSAWAGRRDSPKKKEKDPFAAATGGVFLYSTSAEVKMGKDVKEEVLKQYKLYEDKALVDYVRQVGAKVAAYADRQNITYEFYVLDDPLINAFALPGGTIFITRGILTVFDDEAELAGVLGHEITHVVERHSMKQMQQSTILDIGWKLLSKGQEMPLVSQIAVNLLGFMPYGRADESKADAVGMKYAYEAGYKADRVKKVFEELQKRDDSHTPAFLRSHPADAKRIEQINTLWGLIQTREDIKPGADPLVTNAEAYDSIVYPHTYRVHYPEIKTAFEELAAAIGRKDMDGMMKGIDKNFKSRWLNMSREDFRKTYEQRFAAAEKISAGVTIEEYRFLDKDAISVLSTVTENRTYTGGRAENDSTKVVALFVKRAAKETDGPPWRLAGLEDGGKW